MQQAHEGEVLCGTNSLEDRKHRERKVNEEDSAYFGESQSNTEIRR